MLLSIIIPVYNVAEYLRDCIDSVLANDCADCEIILVDDGATDGICPGICDEYARKHPALIQVIHQENQGLGGARNTGISRAGGAYLFFLDSDDTITPDALTVMKDAIRETGAEIYSFPYIAHDGAGNESLLATSRVFPGKFSLKEHPEFLLSLPVAGARVWKTELFLRSGIRFPGRAWYEDIRTSMKFFALADSIVTLEKPLYRYLQRPGSIMRSSNIARNREIIDAFEDLLGWYRQQDLFNAYRKELCRLAVDHVLLAATVRVAKMDPTSSLLGEFSDYVHREFPDWNANPYLKELPLLHKLLLKLIRMKQYSLIRLLFRIKDRQ